MREKGRSAFLDGARPSGGSAGAWLIAQAIALRHFSRAAHDAFTVVHGSGGGSRRLH